MRFSPRTGLCVLVLLLVTATAQAQVVVPNTPTSGAVVAINGTAGGNPVNILIYDSQIHSGVVGQVPVSTLLDPPPPCSSKDAVVSTDAYVLQGGSATGCSPSDLYEITDVATSIATFAPRTDNNPHQSPGVADVTLTGGTGTAGTGFHIETHFVCVGKCAKGVTGYKTLCNTAGTICITVLNGNPADSGFVVVKNNTGSNFTGSITLQGSSTGCGVASDTATNLAGGASVTLALGRQGTMPDSSTCSGYNYDQVSSPMASSTQSTTFFFGGETFTVNPSNINIGDRLTFRPVPVPAGLFNLPGSTLTNSPFGTGTACVSISDFAAPTGANVANPVCPEFQTKCFKNINLTIACDDAETFPWKGELDGRLDQNAGYPKDPSTGLAEIGGVHFLGAPAANCLQKSFTEDIVLSYVGDSPNDLPLKPGGSGLNCFVASYDPSANAVAPGAIVKAFDGFFPPVQPLPTINPINSGQNVSLNFVYFNGAGGTGVPNLSWCPGGPSLANPNVCATAGVQQPWVTFWVTPLPPPAVCANSGSGPITYNPTNSFMQNQGGGNYKFNWATLSSEPTTNNCFSLGVRFDNGLFDPFVDNFAFTK